MRLGIGLCVAVLALAASAAERSYMLIAKDITIVNGNGVETEKMKAIKDAYGNPVFWFRADGKDYLVRDASVIKQIERMFDPQTELGRQQAALGTKQAALGAKQAALGVKQAGIGARQAVASSAQQEELSRQQEELSRQQGELGRQQEELGRQQETLGRKQAELSNEVNKTLTALTDDLIRRGLAQPIR